MKKIFSFAILLVSGSLFAQVDDLSQMADSLSSNTPAPREFVHASFKTTTVINFPSLETQGKHILDFRISHRFGDFSSGANNAWGLDGPAAIRLAFDYGITDWLQVGIARSSYQKLADVSAKVRILRQTSDNHVPLSMTLLTRMNYTTLKTGLQYPDIYANQVDRISYGTSLIIGRKFTEKFSFELNGFWIHYNIVNLARDKNDMFAAGFSMRYKLGKRFALTAEYAYRINKYTDSYNDFYDPIGFGFDLETGGHVFQVQITNCYGMNEAQFIPYTNSNWLKGNIKLGFNLSRVFTIGHHDGSTW